MATDDQFNQNLLRMIAAELHFKNALQTSREMFGKSYFELGLGEKTIVDQALFGAVATNFQGITPALLMDPQAPQPMGFPIHTPPPTPGSSKP